MILSNCNCGEMVPCNCHPYFDNYQAESAGLLSVGNLVSNSCTLDEYVIDWFRNGEKYMTSGIGNDPDIDTFHPFTGNAAIPVLDGTYVPVIRYVIILGEVIFAGQKQCRKWCPDLSGLPQIIVSAFDCDSGSTGTWSHEIAYSTEMDFAMASRKVTFNLKDGLKYFACSFRADQVADRIEIFYNHESNLLVAWEVGSELNEYRADQIPYREAYFDIKFSIVLPPYQSGDFLIIKVTPSIVSSNPNTTWTAQFKCLTEAQINFEEICNSFPQSLRESIDVNGIVHVDNPSTCSYEIRVPYTEQLPSVPYNARVYSEMSPISGNGGGWVYGSNNYFTARTVNYRTFASAANHLPSYESTTCVNCDKIILTRNDNIFVFTFTAQADYDLYKSRIDSVDPAFYSGFVIDDTDINFYRYFRLYYRKANSCGDAGINTYLYWHITSDMVWDDVAKNLTLTVQNPAINLVCSDPCMYACTTLNNIHYSVNNFLNNDDILGDTWVRDERPFITQAYYLYTPSGSLYGTPSYAVYVSNYAAAPCLTPGGCYPRGVTYYWYVGTFRWEVTDANDPLNNWKLYSTLNPATNCQDNNYLELLKEVSNGIQIYPI